MNLLINLCFVLFVFATLYSHRRIVSDAKTIQNPKTDSTKITSRNSNGANKVFAVRTDAEGRSSQTCQCVTYHQCDRQDVYYPSTSESHIKCGSMEACCTRPLYTDTLQNAATTNSSATEICVAATQCDQHALADNYGLGVLIERSVFSDCPIGEVKCPANKILPNVVSTALPDTSTSLVTEDCRCSPPVYCNADFGENVLKEKMLQCDTSVGELCCPTELIHTMLEVSTQQTPTTAVTECGIRKDVIYDKLAGSSQTTFGEFPWMVVILERVNNQEKVKCGGSLVSPTLVLTAAHCVQDKSVTSFTVRAGEYNLDLPSNLEELPHQDSRIGNITIHHGFARKVLHYDLALLKVDPPFQYSSNVAPVCLPLNKSPYSPEDTSIYDLNKCVATGWGSKDLIDPTPQNVLSKIDLKIIPSDQCVKTLQKSPLGPKFVLHPSLICAMGASGADTCKGDGGGPLACPLRSNPNKYVQVGVIAGGLNCSSPYPSLYASLLLPNSAWITEEIYFKTIFDTT